MPPPHGRGGRRRPIPKAPPSALDPASRIVQFDALLTMTIFLISGVAASDYGTYLQLAFAHIFDPSSTTADLAIFSVLKLCAFTIYAGYLKRNWGRDGLHHLASKSPRSAAIPAQIVAVSLVAVISMKIVAMILFSRPDEMDLPPFLVWAIVIVSAVFVVLEAFMAVRNLESWIAQLSTTAIPKTDLESGTETETAEEAEKKAKEKEELDALKQPIPWKRLGSMLYPEWWIILSGLISLLITTLVNLAIPSFFGKVIDLVSSGTGDKESLSILIIQMVALVLFGAVVSATRSLAFTLTGYRIVRRLRSELFLAIVKQEIAFFDSNSTGEILSRMSSDASTLQNALTMNLASLVSQVLQCVGSLFILLNLSWKLTIVMFSVVPVVVFGALIYGSNIIDMQRSFQDQLAKASSVGQEVISQIRTVRSFAQEERSAATYTKAIESTHGVGVKIAILQAVFSGVMMFAPFTAIAFILYYGAVLVLKGELTSGLLTSFLLYTLTLATTFGGLSGLYGQFMQAIGSGHRIFTLLDRVPAIPIQGGGIELPDDFDGHMVLRNVEFTYPTRKQAKVLNGLNLTLEPGKVLALVGPSGQGKSTVMALLLRFYDPDSGELLVGREPRQFDLRAIDIKSYRTKIGYVSQEPVLFSGTIRENIEYGWQNDARRPTDEEVYSAAKQANAHDFILSFPNGYSTHITERGASLSGGQKQRIAIARALLHNPPILLLDEATSALDAESEAVVQEALESAMVGRKVVVVIAHRLSTVFRADRIAVVEEGKVVEVGQHEEMMKRDGGVYRRLVQRQMQGF